MDAQDNQRSSPEHMLVGSDDLPSVVSIGEDLTVQLGDIVARAHADSGLSVDEWNALPDEDREGLLQLAVQVMAEEAANPPPAEPDPEPEPSDVRVTVTGFESKEVRLGVNGRRYVLTVGEPQTVPAEIVPALRDVRGLTFTQE